MDLTLLAGAALAVVAALKLADPRMQQTAKTLIEAETQRA
jgi:hypothetical protein